MIYKDYHNSNRYGRKDNRYIFIISYIMISNNVFILPDYHKDLYIQ